MQKFGLVSLIILLSLSGCAIKTLEVPENSTLIVEYTGDQQIINLNELIINLDKDIKSKMTNVSLSDVNSLPYPISQCGNSLCFNATDIGTYLLQFDYSGEPNSLSIQIVDTTGPSIKSNTVEVPVGSIKADVTNKLNFSDLSGIQGVFYEYEGQQSTHLNELLNTIGEYPITVIVSDSYNNTTRKNITLIVK